MWIFLLVRKQYLPKKNPALLAPKILEKYCQNSFQVIIRQKKEDKKVAWTPKSLIG